MWVVAVAVSDIEETNMAETALTVGPAKNWFAIPATVKALAHVLRTRAILRCVNQSEGHKKVRGVV